MAHLGESDLARFWQGSLAPADNRRVTRHLLTRCPICLERLQAAFLPEAYEASLDQGISAARRLASRLRKDEERVERGLALLRQKGDWAALTEQEYHPYPGRWTKVEAQLRQGFELRYSAPKEMLSLVDGAVSQAESIVPNAYGESFLFDLRARAWAELANACRVNENYQRAEGALTDARERWMNGSGDPTIRTYIDEVEASLRRDQGRFEEALRLLGKAYRSYIQMGERHLAGRALVNQGNCFRLAARPAESIRAHRQALVHLDIDRDAHLFAVAYQNLLDALVDAGRHAEAGRLLLESGLRQKLAGDTLNLLRVRWVEAKLLDARGRLDDAERAFGEVRAGFREHGLAYDEALAGMDLAGVLLRQKKEALVQTLAQELYTTFAERQIHAEAATALQVFEVACRRQEATAALASKIRRILVELQASPGLRLTFGIISK